MTFSIVASCPKTGMFGIAVSSSSPAVAARCAYARAHVGAVASQNVTDPTLGPRTLDLMEAGSSAKAAVARLAEETANIEHRQVLAVDAEGGTAVYTGSNVLGTFGEARAAHVACAGNLLSDKTVPDAMASAFLDSSGPLGDRLLVALKAALAAGGEEGPVHSAGMMLVRDVPWPVADLRVDWSDQCPIAELDALWRIYAPQLDDYVVRALDPGAAPSYGVPGDK